MRGNLAAQKYLRLQYIFVTLPYHWLIIGTFVLYFGQMPLSKHCYPWIASLAPLHQSTQSTLDPIKELVVLFQAMLMSCRRQIHCIQEAFPEGDENFTTVAAGPEY